mmetsp:Transcript_3666/g.9914  ORF Transcript_3666/g.9914 Transcript_3666/m.9914 type:complete len:219 (-) Transcript_3666:599-1255(-)
MLMVCCTLGWSANTCWKRLSRAGSFSIVFLYLSSVLAPMQRSSPRDSAGLSREPPSIIVAPCAPPAGTRLWMSSMNSTTRPRSSASSFSTCFRRSSNSPGIMQPAVSAPRSSSKILTPMRLMGTSRFTMRCARPSTMAVLPTPLSPINTGLFLVRRERMCTQRRISSSRPMTGSSLPMRADCVRSVVKRSSALSSLPCCPGGISILFIVSSRSFLDRP